jgi:hypothetical protein
MTVNKSPEYELFLESGETVGVTDVVFNKGNKSGSFVFTELKHGTADPATLKRVDGASWRIIVVGGKPRTGKPTRFEWKVC